MNPTTTDATGKYLRFPTNFAHEIALKFATGLLRPSQKEGFKDEVLFTLENGQIMSLPTFAADLIVQHGIKPGEWFKLGKFEVKENQRRYVRWRLERVTPAEPETDLEADLRQSLQAAKTKKPGAPVQWPTQAAQRPPVRAIPTAAAPPPRVAQRPPPVPIAAAPPRSNVDRALDSFVPAIRAIENGPAPHSPVPPAPPELMNGRGENAAAIMSRCYSRAIAIALKAVTEAEGQNLRITPVFEDIRAIAATLLITETQR